MDSIKKQLTFFGSALNIRNKRNDIIASNIANAATPNYKARDINFLDEFKKVTNTGEIKTTHSRHIPTKNYNISELSVEQMQFAENTMKYQTTLKFLNGKITKMISAIRGE